nr:basic proline-rich protein-like [Dasypus novemcinctus]
MSCRGRLRVAPEDSRHPTGPTAPGSGFLRAAWRLQSPPTFRGRVIAPHVRSPRRVGPPVRRRTSGPSPSTRRAGRARGHRSPPSPPAPLRARRGDVGHGGSRSFPVHAGPHPGLTPPARAPRGWRFPECRGPGGVLATGSSSAGHGGVVEDCGAQGPSSARCPRVPASPARPQPAAPASPRPRPVLSPLSPRPRVPGPSSARCPCCPRVPGPSSARCPRVPASPARPQPAAPASPRPRPVLSPLPPRPRVPGPSSARCPRVPVSPARPQPAAPAAPASPARPQPAAPASPCPRPVLSPLPLLPPRPRPVLSPLPPAPHVPRSPCVPSPSWAPLPPAAPAPVPPAPMSPAPMSPVPAAPGPRAPSPRAPGPVPRRRGLALFFHSALGGAGCGAASGPPGPVASLQAAPQKPASPAGETLPSFPGIFLAGPAKTRDTGKAEDSRPSRAAAWKVRVTPAECSEAGVRQREAFGRSLGLGNTPRAGPKNLEKGGLAGDAEGQGDEERVAPAQGGRDPGNPPPEEVPLPYPPPPGREQFCPQPWHPCFVAPSPRRLSPGGVRLLPASLPRRHVSEASPHPALSFRFRTECCSSLCAERAVQPPVGASSPGRPLGTRSPRVCAGKPRRDLPPRPRCPALAAPLCSSFVLVAVTPAGPKGSDPVASLGSSLVAAELTVSSGADRAFVELRSLGF